MDETQDEAFPPGTTQRVVGRVQKWPGVETRLLYVVDPQSGPAYALRDYLTGQEAGGGRYLHGAFVFPPEMGLELAAMVIRGLSDAA